MNKLSLAIAVAIVATPAFAAADFKADLRTCEEQADLRTSTSRNSSATTSAINGGANILGAIIGGRNPAYALSGAAQGTINGAANDARQAEWRRQAMIDQCMRERQNSRKTR